MIDNPEHDAYPIFIDSEGLWFGLSRLVAWYFTLTILNTSRFKICTASPVVLQSFTSGLNRLTKSDRQSSRLSFTFAYGSTSLKNTSCGTAAVHGCAARAS